MCQTPTGLLPLTVLPDATARIDVRGPSGKPAAGVWVLAESASPDLRSAGNGWRVAARIARSDASGRLTLPRAPQEELTIPFAPGSVAAGVRTPRAASADRSSFQDVHCHHQERSRAMQVKTGMAAGVVPLIDNLG